MVNKNCNLLKVRERVLELFDKAKDKKHIRICNNLCGSYEDVVKSLNIIETWFNQGYNDLDLMTREIKYLSKDYLSKKELEELREKLNLLKTAFKEKYNKIQEVKESFC